MKFLNNFNKLDVLDIFLIWVYSAVRPQMNNLIFFSVMNIPGIFLCSRERFLVKISYGTSLVTIK